MPEMFEKRNGLSSAATVSSQIATWGPSTALTRWASMLPLSDKTKAGFYNKQGKDILTLNWKTLEYENQGRFTTPEIEALLTNYLVAVYWLAMGQGQAGDLQGVIATVDAVDRAADWERMPEGAAGMRAQLAMLRASAETALRTSRQRGQPRH